MSKFRVALVTIKITKPSGRRISIAAADLTLHYYHGTKTIGNETSLTIYFVTRLYDYRDPDEQRRPWNDPNVVPSQINGRKDDPRIGNPWDWFYPPHK